MGQYYILYGHDVKIVPLIEWATWFETADRHVAQDYFGDVRVSTVLLGIDHGFGNGLPLLFETMIFGGTHAAVAWVEKSELCKAWPHQIVELNEL